MATSMETWREKRAILVNIRHAERNATDVTTEEILKEVKAPNAIDEVDRPMVHKAP